RYLLRKKAAIADAEVVGAEAREAFVVLRVTERYRIAQPVREFLVPARDQRCAIRDALGGGPDLCLDLIVGNDPRHQTFVLGLARVEDPAFEQDLERRGLPRECDQRTDLGVGHDQSELVDRRTEPARLAADA